jgi:hypothetical protein
MSVGPQVSRSVHAVVLALLVASGSAVPTGVRIIPSTIPPPGVDARLLRFEESPLVFEENRGQTDPRVKFFSRGRGYSVFLASNEVVVTLRNDMRRALSLKVVGGNPRAPITGFGELPGKSNYFIGADRARWRTNLRTYEKVVYDEIYAGIDLIYYGSQGILEYDFVVSPSGDPGIIRLAFEGAAEKTIDDRGDLILGMPDGALRFRKPYAYQTIAGRRLEVHAEYELDPISGELGFELASYDRSTPLIIDPVLVYSTYFGGSGTDFGLGLATDAVGNLYVSGRAGSPDFPTASAFQPVSGGQDDAFVAKIDASGTLIYSTYLGGSAFDQSLGLAVDSSGNVFLTGVTMSVDFPALNAFQPSKAGTEATPDAFVAALDTSGAALLFSTYLGGSQDDFGNAVAFDGSGVHVAGLTTSTNFPVLNAHQPAKSSGVDAFVTKLNASATALVYSTYLGGTGRDEAKSIALDPSGNAYVAGHTQSSNFPRVNPFQNVFGGQEDGFVTKLASQGAVVYSTYLGGEDQDEAHGIAVDGAGSAFVTGFTRSGAFPTLNPIQPAPASGGFRDVFVTKLGPSGTSLLYSTCLGGSFHDEGFGVAIDGAGNAHVAGYTESVDFPTQAPVQAASGGGRDVFLSKINTGGSALVYSTYLGGSETDSIEQNGLAVDTSGAAYVVGYTASADFPTATALQPASGGAYDAFIVKVVDTPPNQPPLAASDNDVVAVNEGTTAANAGTYSDPDVGDVMITASVGSVTKTGTNDGTWSWSFATSDGPADTQTVTITADDGDGGIATTAFELTVNNVSPMAVSDVAATNEETGAAIGVLVNDVDVPADPLSVVSVTSPTVNGGTVTTNGADVTYTPAVNFAGTDSFSYGVGDGDGGAASASVVVTVNPVNDAPVNTVPGPQITGPNTALVFSWIDGNLISIADVDAGGADVRVTVEGISGTITLAGTAGLTFTAGDGTADATMTLTGTTAAVNVALDGLSYDPAPGFAGVGGITITTDDQSNTGAGGPLTDADTVAITVDPAADVDLRLTVSDSPDPVAPSGSLTYTLTIDNDGAFTATGITVFANPPTQASFVSAIASQGIGCILAGSTLTCRLGSLLSGATATVAIVVLAPNKPGMLINRASVAASQQDNNPSNNMEVTLTQISSAP